MRVRIVGVVAVLAVVAGACGESTNDEARAADPPTAASEAEPSTKTSEAAEPAPAGDEGTDSVTPAPAEPVPSVDELLASLLEATPASIDVEVDLAELVGSDVGPEGGSLETVGPDGISYQLTIPPNALLTSERVSMTPVAAASGSPLDGTQVVGVQLEPAGLLFLRPFTLVISGPQVPDDAIGWAADTEGFEFHLVPVASDAGSVTVSGTHFSNWGVGDSELAALVEEIDPETGERRYGVPGAGTAAASLVAVATNTNDATAVALAITAIEYWIGTIEARLQAATGSASIEQATVEIVALTDLLGYLSDDDARADTSDVAPSLRMLFEAWLETVQVDAERLADQCTNRLPDPGFRIFRWTLIVEELAGAVAPHLGGPPDVDEQLARLREQQYRCMTFVLTWQPTVTITEAAGSVVTRASATSEPIRMDGVTGSAPGMLSGSLFDQQVAIVAVEPSFPLPCDAEGSTPGAAAMAIGISTNTLQVGEIGDMEIEGVTAVVGIDEPVELLCAGQDFAFNFFSAELEILNIPRNNAVGYSEFPLEVVREDGAFARTTTSDSSAVGSTAVVEQQLVVTLASES